MNPFETFCNYLALRNHFLKKSYDYFKYNRKTRTTLQSFYKRKDRFWFEKISRKYSEKEIEEFFLANFVSCNDPETLWIGEIVKEGESKYQNWKRKIQSLSYLFKKDSKFLLEEYEIKSLFDCSKGHPIILKKFLANQISLETLVIYDRIFSYSKQFNSKLSDPVWELVGLRIQKYSPFLKIELSKYCEILKDVLDDSSIRC